MDCPVELSRNGCHLQFSIAATAGHSHPPHHRPARISPYASPPSSQDQPPTKSQTNQTKLPGAFNAKYASATTPGASYISQVYTFRSWKGCCVDAQKQRFTPQRVLPTHKKIPQSLHRHFLVDLHFPSPATGCTVFNSIQCPTVSLHLSCPSPSIPLPPLTGEAVVDRARQV